MANKHMKRCSTLLFIRENANQNHNEISPARLAIIKKNTNRASLVVLVVESPPANVGDTGSSPGLGRSHMPWSS